MIGTSPDPPGRVASSDDTEDCSCSSIVTAPDSAVVPTEGVLIILHLFVAFSQFLFLRTLRGSHSCQESVGFYLTHF